jgi:effector-binding domain-containing protein
MQIILSILKFTFFLFLLLLMVSLFLPSETHIERSLVIKQAPEVAYNLVNKLSDWEKWSPWHKIDKKMQIVYNGISEGKGASYSWTSKHDKVGNGKLTIMDAKPFEYILMDMDFQGGGPARCGFYFQEADGGTEVKWTMDSDAGWNLPARYFGLLADYFVGPHFEEGLANLASESAKIALANKYTMSFDLGRVPPTKILAMSSSCPEAQIGGQLAGIYSTLMETIGNAELQMIGPPLAIYKAPEAGIFSFKAGIPVDKKPAAALPAGIEFIELPASEAIVCHFNGAYNKTGFAYTRFPLVMKEKGKTPAGDPWESYVTDPTSVKDPLSVRTEIYWPVR